jgi:nucleolar complex protein 2
MPSTFSRNQKVIPHQTDLIIAFDRLLLIAYKKTPEILQHHVPVLEKNGKLSVPSQNKTLSQVLPLIKSLFRSTLVLLPNLTSSPTTLLVLSQTEKLVPYITGFRKLMRQLIISILDIWSRSVRTANEDDAKADNIKSEEEDAVKISAFLWIRKVMIVGDLSLKQLCLKVSLLINITHK